MYQKKENNWNSQEKSKLIRFGFPAAITLMIFILFGEYGADSLALFIDPNPLNETRARVSAALDALELNDDAYKYFMSQNKYPENNYLEQGLSAYYQLFSFFNRFSNGNERLDYVKFMNEINGVDENNNPTPESRTAGAIFIYNEFKKDGFNVPPPEYMLALCGIESNWRHFSAPGVLVRGVSSNNKGEISSTDWGFCQVNDYYHREKMDLA